MIGNDIIDLDQARRESNWRRNGFLNKLFTPHEQLLIQSASDPDVMVWLLWSMKESAYKIAVRETGYRFFAPQKLVCHLATSLADVVKGNVFYRRTYQVTTSITDRYVASVGFSPDATPFSQSIISFEYGDYQHQHRVIREQLKQWGAARFSVSEERIQLRQDEWGVPTLLVTLPSGKTIHNPVSLSHHGYYGAFAITEIPV